MFKLSRQKSITQYVQIIREISSSSYRNQCKEDFIKLTILSDLPVSIVAYLTRSIIFRQKIAKLNITSVRFKIQQHS